VQKFSKTKGFKQIGVKEFEKKLMKKIDVEREKER